MARNVDYSQQLNDIAAPQESKAGQLMIAAGHSDAAAAVTKGQTNAAAISYVGNAALAADKGRRESNLDSEIKGDIDKLEGYGETAKAAQQNIADAQQQVDMFQQQAPSMQPEQVAEFGQEISRFVQAQRQGVLSRAEVATRIGAAVKRYSAEMPGYAQDFRKLAAERTGISNIDAFGVHQALTTKSAQEKYAEQMQAAQVELDKQIASEMGVPITAISPEMRAFHQASQQLKLTAERAKNKLSLTNMTQEEADKSWGQIHSMQIGSAAAEVAKMFSKMGEVNGPNGSPEAAAKFSSEFSTLVGTLGASVERDVLEMSRPVAGRTPLSTDQQQKMLSSWRAMTKNWQDAAKEIEGRNFLGAAVKNSKDQVELLMNNFKIANPHLTVLNSYGSVSEIVKAWFAIGDKKEFSKRFPGLGEAVEKVMTAPEYHAGVMGSAFSGQGVNLPAVAQMSPELAKVAASDMVHSIKEWSKEPNPTDQKKSVFANTFAAFYSTPANFNPSVPRNLEAAYSTLAAPETQRFFSQLSPEQRKQALLPLVTNIEDKTHNVAAQLRSELDAWNTGSDNVMAQRQGRTLALQRNAITGSFEVVERQGEATKPGPTGVSANFSYIPPNFAPRAKGVEGTNAREARARAEGLATTMNRMLETYTLGVRSLGVPGVDATLPQVQEQAHLSYMEGERHPLLAGRGLGSSEGAAPDKPEGFDENKFKTAIRTAEQSFSAKGQGVSNMGARGPYQFMEETAKRFGLKVDPAAGLDERTDEHKSGSAAVKYGQELSKMFKGDMAKVAAAYNAGEGNVMRAVEKAKEQGIPELWQAFLPKPKETVPYIKRFVEHYTK